MAAKKFLQIGTCRTDGDRFIFESGQSLPGREKEVASIRAKCHRKKLKRKSAYGMV